MLLDNIITKYNPIIHLQDNLGREHIEIEGNSFTILKIISFEEWIRNNYASFDNFMNLKRKDKEVIFLRWKWGLSDNVNQDLEASETQTLHLIKDFDLSGIKQDVKFYLENKIVFNKYCFHIKGRIGLLELTEEDNVLKNKVIDAFEGKEIK